MKFGLFERSIKSASIFAKIYVCFCPGTVVVVVVVAAAAAAVVAAAAATAVAAVVVALVKNFEVWTFRKFDKICDYFCSNLCLFLPRDL